VTDLPFINLNEGRWLLGVGIVRWRQVWDEVYKFKVLHWMTPRSVVVNLDSLLVAVYPHIEKDTTGRALVAMQFMWKVVDQRQKEIEIRRDRRIEKDRKSKLAEVDEGDN
jgi:hypothetical protein